LSVLLAAGGVAASFQPLKERISALIDTYVFKGRYDYRKVVVEFGDSISRILDLRELEKCVVNKTIDTMRAENGVILVADARFEEYRAEYGWFPGAHITMDRVLLPGNALLEELRQTQKPIVEQEIRRTRTEREASALLQEMARVKSAIAVPLVSKGEMLGILSLGEKKSGDIYSAEDVSLLTVLANQAAPSLENSRLFNEILVMKNHQDNILQHLRSGVITVDRDNQIKSANKSAAEILNRTRNDFIGQDVSVLGERLTRLVMERLQEGFGHFEGDVQVDVEGRGSVPLGVVATTMAGERDAREVLLVFDDLSEVKLLQERIRRADRLAVVGTFAAGMAHEIKNPLVPIKTFSQLLPEMFDDQEFRQKFSVLVLKEVERINQIIEKLLNFARPTKPVLGPCDMHELVDEVLLLLEEDVRRKNIHVGREYTIEEAIITVDKEQIKQVLMNLLLNAVQAVEGEGRIDVCTAFVWEQAKDSDRLRLRGKKRAALVAVGENDKVRQFEIRISDTGCGISEDDLKHLFNPFFTTKPEGTGLGLAISHVIVQEHNGTLDAESEPGRGATFTLRLPATDGL
jgi:signal transduction histidine kinase